MFTDHDALGDTLAVRQEAGGADYTGRLPEKIIKEAIKQND